MNSGTIWGRFVEKRRGKKSRATVPLSSSGLNGGSYAKTYELKRLVWKGNLDLGQRSAADVLVCTLVQ